jgi:hypothetical protein
MAKPTTRKEFKEYCLRKMGHPVIKINLDNDQIEDRIDEAIQYYNDYHFDGAEKIYYKHLVTQTDIDNKYITIPGSENVIGITRIFNIGDPSMNASDIFNIRYQIALNDMYTLTSVSMTPYYLAMEHLALIQELLVGQQPIRFNRHMNRISVDMNWDKAKVGNYLLFEGYKALDPDTYSDMWNDRWLQNYTVVLLTEAWGRILTKFDSMQLVGGVKFNGNKILDDARKEREKLEAEMITTYSLPAYDFFG